MSSVNLQVNPQQAANMTVSTVVRVDVLPLSLDVADTVIVPGLGTLYRYPVYWFALEQAQPELVEQVAREILVDPILQRFVLHSQQQDLNQPINDLLPEGIHWVLETQYLPGVTDNLGKTVETNLGLLFPGREMPQIKVASGYVFWVGTADHTAQSLQEITAYQLFNPLVQRIEAYPAFGAQWSDTRFRFPLVTGVVEPKVDVISLEQPDEALKALSQERCLALSLEELKAIQAYYRRSEIKQARTSMGLPEDPTDVELEIFAQTWSEHCKHKIFGAYIDYTDYSDPDYPCKIEVDSLYKTYIKGTTEELSAQRPDLLSVFKDNAGVVQWNDDVAVCFKVETHNSPSALEPYGGALTGIVGVNRDILGTGMGAKPIFNTDIFCFANPDQPHSKRPTMLPAESILQGVRKGVEDGGNKSGIPTVNGSLYFDPRYRAKPLVFCGTGGVLPLKIGDKLGYEKYTQPGDTIVMAGGRVGKDGIHGATFSSEALTESSPVSAVQIGDPLTQKRMTDFLLEARDRGLLTGLTDNGAGGLSSSVGEMAQMTNGATLHLERVPLKYTGLMPYEIVVSESQERMTFSTRQFEALEKLAQHHGVEVSAIGEFHDRGAFEIQYQGKTIASLDLAFLHDGVPQMQLEAIWEPDRAPIIRSNAPDNPDEILLKLLGSPNICSREALIRQYDHEVQGRSVVKPLMGTLQTGPCDAAVQQVILGEQAGIVVSNGLCPQFSDWDPYHMAMLAVDEAVRNAVAVGADPKTIALLDNFCWPDPIQSKKNLDGYHKLAQLVRSCVGLKEIALAYRTPLISGKDSMKNDFDDGKFRLSIPPTLLISAIGKIPDISKAVTMEFKAPGDRIFLLGDTSMHFGGSQYYLEVGWSSPYCPQVNIILARRTYQLLHEAMMKGWIRSCHDCSEGGMAVALAESTLACPYGVEISLAEMAPHSPELRWDELLFSESPSRFILSVAPEHEQAVREAFKSTPLLYLGQVTEEPRYKIAPTKFMPPIDLASETLRLEWQKPPAACYDIREGFPQ